MARASIVLELGERLEFWAQGPGRVTVFIQGQMVWQIPALSATPAPYCYHHREAAETTIEWDETVIVTPEVPAVGTETIEVPNPDHVAAVPGKPAVPAVGTPTIEVENENYVEARSEVIKHAAVTCPVVEKPKPVSAPVKAAVVDDSLAATGGELPLVLGGLGVLALIAGGLAVYFSRRKKATEVADSVDAE